MTHKLSRKDLKKHNILLIFLLLLIFKYINCIEETKNDLIPKITIPLEGLITLQDYHESYSYLIPVVFGTNETQTLHLIVDTLYAELLTVECELNDAPNMECLNTNEDVKLYPKASTWSSNYCELGISNVTLEAFINPENHFNYSITDFDQPQGFCVSHWDKNVFSDWNYDGIFGLSYRSDWNIGQYTRFLPKSWPHVYALNLNFNEPSFIDFGGFNHQNEIVWSEKQTAKYSSVTMTQLINVFNFSICGHPITHSSTFLQTKLSSVDNCLAMPNSYYNNLKAWLYEDCFDSNDGLLRCNFDDSFDLEKLPELTFHLSQFSDKEFVVPLFYLILDLKYKSDNMNQITFCIQNIDTVSNHNDGKMIFGNKILSLFYTVFDMASYRVGLYQKEEYILGSDYYSDLTYCVSKENDCVGDQTFYEPSNECLNPECGLYFFQELDSSTKTCQWNLIFVLITLFFLVLMIMIELLLTEAFIRGSPYAYRLGNSVNNND